MLQIEGLEASNQACADRVLMGEHQNRYLQQQLESCQQKLAQLQVPCPSLPPTPYPPASSGFDRTEPKLESLQIC